MLGFGEGLCDGKADARIADALDQNVVRTIKAGEHTRQFICWNSTAAVCHLDEDEFGIFLASCLDLEPDRALERSRRPCILQQMNENLLQSFAVSMDRRKCLR